MWCLKVLVRDQNNVDLDARLQLCDFCTLLIQQIRGNINGDLRIDGCRIFLHRFFLNHAQHLQCRRFNVPNDPGAIAAGAGHVVAFIQRRSQALARHLHQAKSTDLANLNPGAIDT